ncbi:hypothetical protein DH2020_018397 [Rehmannia glutinosa]|uniref:Protein kinase domain-containing protein n=1 Tax=Rehmannia glutinosa TaxID=99300 RepID=A0ABR0WJZ6_REHGL
MARKPTVLPRAIVLTLAVLLQYYAAIPSLAESEAEILLKFKESLENTGALSDWSNAKPPCNGDQENWVGIFCENGTVWGIQLQNMGLEGIIDVDALTKLVYLRTISFMGNNFDGPLPNLTRLSALKSIYLSNNKFSGDIPANIPEALAALPRLKELMLENNDFVGEIPKFPQDRIKSINVSHNELVGEIPVSLSKFSASAFEGRQQIFMWGPTEIMRCPRATLRRDNNHRGNSGDGGNSSTRSSRHHPPPPQANTRPTICGWSRRPRWRCCGSKQNGTRPAIWLRFIVPEKSGHSKKSDPNVKITFLNEERDKFDMSDLLKASAEILGSGVFGSTYKAALNDGELMVVKRFRYMNNVNKEEFHEHMRRLGRLSHPNVLPVVGFYYRKEEKLLVTDYVEKVSLAVQLHGNRSKSRPCPDWPTRLRIVKGVARGLLYLYNELPSLTAPHGHLKSSNVLLDGSYTPLLTDYGLVPVVNPEYAQEHMISYKSPEYKHSGRITKKTDVWSLGVLILEILTGKFPSNFLQQGNGGDTADIASWVESAVRGGDSSVRYSTRTWSDLSDSRGK